MLRSRAKCRLFLFKRQSKLSSVSALAALLLFAPHTYAGDLTVAVKKSYSDEPLADVKLQIPALQRNATSASNGNHVFKNIPGGTYMLVTTYDGFKPVKQRVVVPRQGRRQVTVGLSPESLRLGKLKVTGNRVSNIAIDTKRVAPNILDAATAKQIRQLPDPTIASALKRLPGVNAVKSARGSNAEGGTDRFITIRGFEPNLNNVTVNGNELITPDVRGRSGRSGALDVLSSAGVQQIQVVKSLRPDMDGSAIGGTINIVTPSAFDHNGAFGRVDAKTGYNDLSQKSLPSNLYSVDFLWGNTFGNGLFGLAVSGNIRRDNSVFQQAAQGTNFEIANGFLVPRGFRLEDFNHDNRQRGLNVNLEYRPNNNTHLHFRFIYSDFLQFRNTLSTETDATSDGPPANQTPTTGTYSNGRTSIDTEKEKVKRQLTYLALGSKQKFGNLTADYELTYGQASEKRPFGQTDFVQFRSNKSFTINYDTSKFIYDFNAPSRFDPAQIGVRRFRQDAEDNPAKTYSPKLDLRWNDSLWGYPGFIQGGVKFTHTRRSVNDSTERYVLNDSAPDLSLASDNFASPGSEFRNFQYGPVAGYFAFKNYFQQNPQYFQLDREGSLTNSIEDNYEVTEEILAGYGEGSLDIGNLHVLAGVRVEQTKDDFTANQALYVGGDFQGIQPVNNSKNFTEVLPNIQFRYALRPNLLLRAAYTESFARPNFTDTAPITTLETEAGVNANVFTGSLTTGNPDLKSFESKNFDADIEWYPSPSSIVSLAFFYKQIDNPIFTRVMQRNNFNFRGRSFEHLSVTMNENAKSGEIRGLELNLRDQFMLLPSPLDGFGINSNFTYIDSSTETFERPGGNLPFFFQPDRLANVGIFYRKYGFEAEFAWNFRDNYLRTLGDSAYLDEWQASRSQFDFKASYHFGKHFSVYGSASNLTDSARNQYQGNQNLLLSHEYFGRTFGVSFTARY